ncbi:MAG: fibronectin type III domain-containing protein [Ilumatobacteraceae bacterium]
MGTFRHRLALVLAALLTLGGVMLSTIPTTVSADGSTALAGAARAATDRITAGAKHSCAITSDGDLAGTVICWGNNLLGQLGVGDTLNRGDQPGELGNAVAFTELGQAAVSISAGFAHTCAVLEDGTVKCWGYNADGQLGLGDIDTRGDDPNEMGGALTAVSLGTGRTAVSVASGVDFSCALLDDGSVKCWGANAAGQLGQGDTVTRGDGPNEMGDHLAPVDLGTGRTAIAIEAGGAHVCAVLDTHQLKCWGNNDSGQLGLGDTVSRGDGVGELGDALPTVDLGPDADVSAVAAGLFHTCAIVTVHSVKCWGDNAHGQLATGDTLDLGDQSGEMGDALPTVVNDIDVFVTGIVALSNSSCWYEYGLTARCWGANGHGQLAMQSAGDKLGPILTDVLFTHAMAGGDQHMCWVRDGAVRCSGLNDSGQLGVGDTVDRGDVPNSGTYTTVDLRQVETPTKIVAGGSHSCFLLAGGRVRCVGYNASGQLGLGDTVNRGADPSTVGDAVPTVDLGTGRHATDIDAGESSVCAILDNGTVKCWGSNAFGQLGVGDTTDRGDGPGEMGDNLPTVALGTGRTAVAISVGRYHACAILDNGTVKCWGSGNSGRLGNENTVDIGDQPGEMGNSLPTVNLGTGRTAKRITAGYVETCAILDNDALKCWGYNSWGVLGQGDKALRGHTPGTMGDNLPAIDLGTGRHAVQVEAYLSACALLDNGTVKCWGMNESGIGGQGDVAIRGDGPGEMGDNLPSVPLGTGRTATSIVMGYQSACAVLDNAAMKCWGNNSGGQAGTDDAVSRGDNPGEMGDNLPAAKLGGVAAVALASGDYHRCVLLGNGRTRCFGWNNFGQLSLGLTDYMSGNFVGSMATAPYAEVGGILNRILPLPARPGVTASVVPTVGIDQVALQWAAPASDGGAAITGYRVEKSTDDGVHWTTAIANTATATNAATVTGLANGTAHRFRVAAINAKGAGPVSLPSASVVPAGVPAAPAGLVATPGDGQVSLTWSVPASNGRTIVGYTIQKSVDNGATWTAAGGTTSPSVTVSGLANFTPVRFRVLASNSMGNGTASAATAAVTPVTTGYWPLKPARLADTRTGAKTVDGTFAAGGALKAGRVMTLRVGGRGGVPTGAKAAVLTVMVTKPSAKGSVSVYPCGSARGAATTVSFAAGATVSNSVMAKIGTNGNVCLWSSAATQLVVDVHGIHPSGNGSTPLNPARLLSNGSIAAGKAISVKVTGRAGVSTTAKAVTLNVTAVAPIAATKITVFACGSTRPSLATINVKAGATVSNMTITKVGTGGAICVHSSTATKVHVDVLGAHGTSSFKSVAPTRLATKAMTAKSTLTVVTAGKAGIPAGTRAAVVNVTVSKAAVAGSLTVYACGTSRPATTSVAYAAGTTVSQTLVAGILTNGSLCVYSTAAATVTVDAVGNH